MQISKQQFEAVIDLAETAGTKVMEIYDSGDFSISAKDDDSPLTHADLASHDILVSGLSALFSEIPVISEEAMKHDNDASLHANLVWVIDPIDGTKEFIEKTGEFTINIGLLSDAEPVAGVVYAPAINELFWAFDGSAFKRINGQNQSVTVSKNTTVKRAVASKSHFDEKTEAFLKQFSDIELVQAGSSLKICRVAEGAADIYPRFAPTMEWDTCAADAVLRAAGGQMLGLDGNDLQYRKPELRNVGFVADNTTVFYSL